MTCPVCSGNLHGAVFTRSRGNGRPREQSVLPMIWIWHNFKISLPESWEMLQFSRNRQEGRCAFADRTGFRCELSWREVPGKPDFERMLTDYRSKLEEDGYENTSCPRCGPWQGIESSREGRTSSRFGRFFPNPKGDGRKKATPGLVGWRLPGRREQLSRGPEDTNGGRLVEIVFLWPGQRDQSMVNHILSSFAILPGNGFAPWSAFGMNMLVDHGLDLDKVDVQPARIEMSWRDRKGLAEARFCRLGMVPSWLSAPVAQWLMRWVGSKYKVSALRSLDMGGGHYVERVSGIRRTGGLLGGRIRCRADAWICPRDGRLYAVANSTPTRGHPEQEESELAGSVFFCCHEMRRGNNWPDIDYRHQSPRESLAGGRSPEPEPGGSGESWINMLQARVVPNLAARVETNDAGHVVVHVRNRRSGLLAIPPVSWMVPIKPERVIELDAVGSQLWRFCLEQGKVEKIVDAFADRYKLSFHEARVSVNNYLSTLIRRGAIVIELAEDPGNREKAK